LHKQRAQFVFERLYLVDQRMPIAVCLELLPGMEDAAGDAKTALAVVGLRT